MSAEKTLLIRRLNNVAGQLNGIAKMLAESRDCFTVLPQLKAARAGLDKATALFIQQNLHNCLKQKPLNESELEKILLELTKK
jgi:DNA-binding FrmR family transcriptional regulator